MLFISHSEEDKEYAEKLIDFIESSLKSNDLIIRCTSVAGYQLPFGSTISQQLKEDINKSKVLIVILSKKSLSSNWVLFELGAAWGLDITVIPVLDIGLTHRSLPGPLSSQTCIEMDSINSANRLRDAITQISKEFDIVENPGSKSQDKLDKFIAMYSNAKEIVSVATNEKAFEHKTTENQVDKKISIEEYIYINDLILKEILPYSNYICYTFGKTRRVLPLIIMLKNLSEKCYSGMHDKIPTDVRSNISKWYSELKKIIVEVQHIFPVPKDEEYFVSMNYLEEYKKTAMLIWLSVKNHLMELFTVEKSILEKLNNDDTYIWKLLGFKNEIEYNEFILPEIDYLLNNKSNSDIKILNYVSEKINFTDADLMECDLDKINIIETINILIRSNLITYDTEEGSFHLRNVGFEIIKKEFIK
jgi:hypothetical protein